MGETKMSAQEKFKGKFKHFLHVYERSKTNEGVYRCINPRCRHYDRKALLLGKIAECPKCQQEFVLDQRSLNIKTPTCHACSNSPKLRAIASMQQPVIDDIMIEIMKLKNVKGLNEE